jgi:hypothetical protein
MMNTRFKVITNIFYIRVTHSVIHWVSWLYTLEVKFYDYIKYLDNMTTEHPRK